MILKSVKLENIRSYILQTINFPRGSILLAGDIGSGKSTILLAIEFAFFGLKSGELTGSALLRHGCNEGGVELCLEINGKEIRIRRNLKRTRDRIGQVAGYIICDNIKENLMPKEIRARVLSFLNYPESLIAKGQDLIYRFTVYTPQEQMKKIIYEEADLRLDTLRKVFNIDKYKMIKENVIVYMKLLRERRIRLEGVTSDLEEKRKQKNQLSENINKQMVLEAEAKGEFIDWRKKTIDSKKKLDDISLQIKKINEKKRQLAVLDSELRNLLDNRANNQKQIGERNLEIQTLEKQLLEYLDEGPLKVIYDEKEKESVRIERERTDARKQRSEIEGRVKHLRDTCSNVMDMDKCSLCFQDIGNMHKEKIEVQTKGEIEKLHVEFLKQDKMDGNFSEKLMLLKKELKDLNEKISVSRVLKVKGNQLTECKKKIFLLRADSEKIKDKVGAVNAKKILINKEVTDILEIEEKFQTAEKEYSTILANERKSEISLNSIVNSMEGLRAQLDLLCKELALKEKSLNDLKKISQLSSWLAREFVPLVGNIEKHVMLTIYHEFNELFSSWFSSLVEDENLSVSLDDSFSAKVIQNGYDTTIDNLSGGEKTSVALAYRLALNKVINDVVSQINTKDILILDEPTEGFSSDQLDRVRDVLEDIGVSQIIVVSHESKIESFMDNIIRISKSSGVSVVA